MTLWSRLPSEPIWERARTAHRRGYVRVYHDWDRVLRLYERAGSELRLPYDRALDLAILSHSAVVDSAGDRGARSAAWLRSHAAPDEPVEAACQMILAAPYRDLTDPRLPLLQLSDLTDPESAERAMSAMIEQVTRLSGLNREEAIYELVAELARVRRALRAALPGLERPALRAAAERVVANAVFESCG